MRLKLLLITLLGAVAINGAYAGTCNFCPPVCKDKCPIGESPDCGGEISVDYTTAYIFRGVRLVDDAIIADVNYTFEKCCVPITVGVSHVTSLNSPANAFGMGDQTDIYGEVALPSLIGLDVALRYDHYFYTNGRNPSGVATNAAPGIADSHGALSLRIARELFCGVVASYTRTYDTLWPAPYQARAAGLERDSGGWLHTLDFAKTFCINDCMALELNGGVTYSDNIWGTSALAAHRSGDAAGWNNYHIQAALPIAVSRCATLTPYLGYNGTPEDWMADDIGANGRVGDNENDVFYGGVRITVGF